MCKLVKKTMRKGIAAACSVVLTASLMTGCSSFAAAQVTGTNNTVATEAAEDTSQEKTFSDVYGKVVKIDGNVVTLALGEMTEGSDQGIQDKAPDGLDNGEAPKAPDGTPPAGGPDGTTVDGTEPPEKPSGNTQVESTDGKTPVDMQGKVPGGKSGGAQGAMTAGIDPGIVSRFSESGEELTITIEDESMIHVKNVMNELEEGNLEDITAGSILFVEYDDSGSVASVTLQILSIQAPPKGNKTEPQAESDLEQAANETERTESSN